MNRIFYFMLFFAGIFFMLPLANAQKIKEKKDIVYVDDVPQFKIEKTEGSLFSPRTFVVTSMKGDTLVVFDGDSYMLPALQHEMSGYYFPYFVARFKASGLSGITGYDSKGDIMDLLVKSKIVVDGVVIDSAAQHYLDAQKRFILLKNRTERALELRKKLKGNSEYDKYSKTLVKRDYSLKRIKIASGTITVDEVAIGNIKLQTDNNYGTTYWITTLAGKNIGSIFYEKGRKRIFIKALYGDVGEEWFIESDKLGMTEQIDALRYLIDFGFL